LSLWGPFLRTEGFLLKASILLAVLYKLKCVLGVCRNMLVEQRGLGLEEGFSRAEMFYTENLSAIMLPYNTT